MAITIIYRVEVPIPQDVFDKYFGKDNCQYAHEVNDAIRGYIEAGDEYYGDPFVYATFSTRNEAEKCERELIRIMKKYHKGE